MDAISAFLPEDSSVIAIVQRWKRFVPLCFSLKEKHQWRK